MLSNSTLVDSSSTPYLKSAARSQSDLTRDHDPGFTKTLSSLRRSQSRRPRLRDPEPIEELHRDIRAGTHRFFVRTLHIDRTVALLDAEMGGFGGRQRALAERTAERRLRRLPSGGWTARL
jgi:hypothetical protein